MTVADIVRREKKQMKYLLQSADEMIDDIWQTSSVNRAKLDSFALVEASSISSVVSSQSQREPEEKDITLVSLSPCLSFIHSFTLITSLFNDSLMLISSSSSIL